MPLTLDHCDHRRMAIRRVRSRFRRYLGFDRPLSWSLVALGAAAIALAPFVGLYVQRHHLDLPAGGTPGWNVVTLLIAIAGLISAFAGFAKFYFEYRLELRKLEWQKEKYYRKHERRTFKRESLLGMPPQASSVQRRHPGSGDARPLSESRERAGVQETQD